MATISERPPKSRRRWWKAIAVLIAIVAAYIAGFAPEHSRSSQLENRLNTAHEDLMGLQTRQQLMQLRGEINEVYLQVTRNNYGLAAAEATEFFGAVNTVLNQTQDADLQQALRKIAARRDMLIAGLAQADAAVRKPVGEIVDEMNEQAPAGQVPAPPR